MIPSIGRGLGCADPGVVRQGRDAAHQTHDVARVDALAELA